LKAKKITFIRENRKGAPEAPPAVRQQSVKEKITKTKNPKIAKVYPIAYSVYVRFVEHLRFDRPWIGK